MGRQEIQGGNISGFGEGKADETQLEAIRIIVGLVCIGSG